MRIFGYIRTNTGKLETFKHNPEWGFRDVSYELQKEMILEYLNKKYTIKKTGKTYKVTKPQNVEFNWYADRNESVNEKFEKRRYLKMILDKMKKGDLIVVSHFNRLFLNNVDDNLNLMERVKEKGVSIVLCEFGESVTGNNKSSKVVHSLLDNLTRMKKIKNLEISRRTKDEEKKKKRFTGGKLKFGKTFVMEKMPIDQYMTRSHPNYKEIDVTRIVPHIVERTIGGKDKEFGEAKIIEQIKHLSAVTKNKKKLSLNKIRDEIFKKYEKTFGEKGFTYTKPVDSKYLSRTKTYEISEKTRLNNSYLTTQTISNIIKDFETNKSQSVMGQLHKKEVKVSYRKVGRGIPFGQQRVDGILVDDPIQQQIIQKVIKYRNQKTPKGKPLPYKSIQEKIENDFIDKTYDDGSKITLSHTAIGKILRIKRIK